MSRGAAALALALLLGLGAEDAAAHRRVRAHASLVQCPVTAPPEQPLLFVFDNAAQWRAAMQADAATILGRDVLWHEERAVVFTLERQPTLGVHVDLDAARVVAARGRLTLPVSVRRPAAGEMAATALSRPCVVAAVLRAGWNEVRVIDREGAVLARQRARRGTPPPAAVPRAPDPREVFEPRR